MSFKLIWASTKEGKRRFSKRWSSGAKAYLRGYHAGDAYFESLETSNRSVAAQKFSARQKEITDGADSRRDSTINFAGAVAMYFGSGDPKVLDPTGRVARIFDKFGEKLLSAITQADLDALARELHPKAGPQTLNREVYTPFVAIYNAPADADKVVPRRWRRPKGAHKSKPVNAPSDTKVGLVIKAATRKHGRSPWEIDRNRAAILTFSLAGDRTGALVRLTWADIDLDQNTIYFAQTKNGEPRTVLMAPLLHKAMKQLATHTHKLTDRVFGWETRAGPARMISTACKAAGVGRLRPHDVGRHAFGRRGRQSIGFDRAEMQKAGNWKSDKAAARYDHMAVGSIMERIRDVDTTELEKAMTSGESSDIE